MLVDTGLRVARYGSSIAMAPHCHDDASMNIVASGGFLERIGRNERQYESGHIAFFPAGTEHSQQFGAAGASQVIFTPRASWLAYLADCRLDLNSAPYAREARFRRMARAVLDELRNADNFSAIACEGILLEIVAAFGRSCTAARTTGRPPAWLAAARDYIHAHPSQPLAMASIAKVAGRHEVHVAREFRRHYGVSVSQYLRRLRVAEASRLLEHSSLGICEIAHACGFATHAHLCREFKAQLGVTPSAYRAACN